MNRDTLGEEAKRLAGQLVSWRRMLHREPELGFRETRTAALVETRLRGLGLEVRRVAGTGVVGILHASSSVEPAVLLRADMDALPVQEVEGREYGSQISGCMHACGHDGHMAMLLGAATLLAARRTELRRDVVFCFQPGEEGMGGARKMIEAGVLRETGAASAYALHLWSLFPAGTLHIRSGPIMAGQDEFTARVVGRGGHGAQPHRAEDPIVAAAHGIVALQSVVSRSVDPMEAAVVSVGSVHAGSAPNVIPGEVRLDGTLRSFHDEVRHTLRARVLEVLENTAAAHRCRLEFELRAGYPPVINDPTAAEKAREAAEAVVGAEKVYEAAPMAAAEDFAYFLQEVPGAFILLGAGNEPLGINAPHHSPEFDIDESALPIGAEFLVRLAVSG